MGKKRRLRRERAATAAKRAATQAPGEDIGMRVGWLSFATKDANVPIYATIECWFPGTKTLDRIPERLALSWEGLRYKVYLPGHKDAPLAHQEDPVPEEHHGTFQRLLKHWGYWFLRLHGEKQTWDFQVFDHGQSYMLQHSIEESLRTFATLLPRDQVIAALAESLANRRPADIAHVAAADTVDKFEALVGKLPVAAAERQTSVRVYTCKHDGSMGVFIDLDVSDLEGRLQQIVGGTMLNFLWPNASPGVDLAQFFSEEEDKNRPEVWLRQRQGIHGQPVKSQLTLFEKCLPMEKFVPEVAESVTDADLPTIRKIGYEVGVHDGSARKDATGEVETRIKGELARLPPAEQKLVLERTAATVMRDAIREFSPKFSPKYFSDRRLPPKDPSSKCQVSSCAETPPGMHVYCATHAEERCRSMPKAEYIRHKPLDQSKQAPPCYRCGKFGGRYRYFVRIDGKERDVCMDCADEMGASEHFTFTPEAQQSLSAFESEMRKLMQGLPPERTQGLEKLADAYEIASQAAMQAVERGADPLTVCGEVLIDELLKRKVSNEDVALFRKALSKIAAPASVQQPQTARQPQPSSPSEVDKATHEAIIEAYMRLCQVVRLAAMGGEVNATKVWPHLRDAVIFELPTAAYLTLFAEFSRYIMRSARVNPDTPDDERTPAQQKRIKDTVDSGCLAPFPEKLPFRECFFAYGSGVDMASPWSGEAMSMRPDPRSVLYGHLVTADGLVASFRKVEGEENGKRKIAAVFNIEREGGEWNSGMTLSPWIINALVAYVNEHKTLVEQGKRSGSYERFVKRTFKSLNPEGTKPPIPPPFYVVYLKDVFIKERAQAQASLIKRHIDWQHRWKVRGHECLRFQRGLLPLDPELEKELRDRKYKIFTVEQPDSETFMALAQRGIPPKATAEWMAVLRYWQQECIHGPDDKPIIESVRRSTKKWAAPAALPDGDEQTLYWGADLRKN